MIDSAGQPIYQAAIQYLALREYGRQELSLKLKKKCADNALIDAVLDLLESEGYLSEVRYVEQVIRAKQNRGYGPIVIRQTLQQKGVNTDTIEHCLNTTEEDWSELALAAKQKKFGNTAPTDFNDKLKQTRFLQYRGFTREQIDCALEAQYEE